MVPKKENFEIERYCLVGCYDPREDDPEQETRLEKLKRACLQTIEEIDDIAGHRCDFGDDHYCGVCGLDGRA